MGLTTSSGRNVEPGPVSFDGSGALRGSSRYSVAWYGGVSKKTRHYVRCQLPYPVLVARLHLFQGSMLCSQSLDINDTQCRSVRGRSLGMYTR